MLLVSLVDAALALAGEQRERRRSDSGGIVFRIGRHNSLLGRSQYRRKGCAIPVSYSNRGIRATSMARVRFTKLQGTHESEQRA